MITKACSGREVSTLRRSGGDAGKSPVPAQKRSFCVRSVRARSLSESLLSVRSETACDGMGTGCDPRPCPEDRGWDLGNEDLNLDSVIQSHPKTRRFAPGKWFFGKRLSKNVFCCSAGAGHTRPAFALPTALRGVIEARGRLPGSTREVILPLSEDNGAGCGLAARRDPVSETQTALPALDVRNANSWWQADLGVDTSLICRCDNDKVLLHTCVCTTRFAIRHQSDASRKRKSCRAG